MVKELYLAGEWRRGNGEVFATHYPADGSVVAEVQAASVADVDEAATKAEQAWQRSDWSGLLPHQRAQVLYRIAHLIRENAEQLAQLQLLDNGKPINETRALTQSAANTFQYYGAVLECMNGDLTPSRGDYLTFSTHEPLGVVAAITPWNSPIASEAQKVAPALAGGNSVILKPSELTPLIGLELAKICEQAGVPPGVLSVLPGPGSVVGQSLVAHPLVRKVSFTGGTRTGRVIGQVAAEKIMPVSLELGGKSPTLVFEDADMDHAVNGVLFGIFSSSGEACIAGSRLFVQRSVFAEFLASLTAKAKTLKVGDPKRESTQMGPLITAAHRSSVESYIQLARDEGGEVILGGDRPQGSPYDNGFFLNPTIVAGLSNRTRTCQEEIFGPVLVVLPFDDEDDLMAQANETVFGLAAGIWTEDARKAWRVAQRLHAGTVWINTYKQFSITTPFGGYKQSGIGTEKGVRGIQQYMRQKSVYWGMNSTPLPWAGPV